MHIREGDHVKVIAGDDKGQTGKVLRIDHLAGKVVVEGVARVYKHVRRSQRNPQGGRLNKEMPIQLSNVMFVCGSCGQATRTGARIESDGSKIRYCKKCGATNGQISPAKARRAAAASK